MPIAHLEEVFERRPEKVDNHHVVVTLLSGPNDPGHAGVAHERLVDLGFVLERTVFCDGGLDFDSDFLAGDGVHAVENGTCDGHDTRRRRDKSGVVRWMRYVPQPPMASSSSRRYFPPNVKSILGEGGAVRAGIANTGAVLGRTAGAEDDGSWVLGWPENVGRSGALLSANSTLIALFRPS